MMRGYAETTGCRRQFLLGYFGEQLDEPCGNCDTCEAGTARVADPGRTPRPRTRASTPGPGRHAEWGAGVVMRTEPDRVTVLFAEHGYKTLSLDAVRDNACSNLSPPTSVLEPLGQG